MPLSLLTVTAALAVAYFAWSVVDPGSLTAAEAALVRWLWRSARHDPYTGHPRLRNRVGLGIALVVLLLSLFGEAIRFEVQRAARATPVLEHASIVDLRMDTAEQNLHRAMERADREISAHLRVASP